MRRAWSPQDLSLRAADVAPGRSPRASRSAERNGRRPQVVVTLGSDYAAQGEARRPRGAEQACAPPALARLSLVVLVAATFLAIFYAQELKRQPPLLQYAEPGASLPFQPAGALASPHVHRFAHFKVRGTSVGDTLAVSIVNERTGRDGARPRAARRARVPPRRR